VEPSIFISYSRDDEKHALHLLQILRGEGYTVWIDQEAIAGATIWSDEIVRNIKSCQVFIALLSPSSTSSPNVGKEIALAAENGKVILPIEIGHVTLPGRLEYALAGIQRTNIHDEAAILRALKSQFSSLPESGSDLLAARKKRKQRMLAVGLMLILVAVIGWVFISRKPTEAAMPTNTIVVLPFSTLNLDRDSTRNLDIFSDALISRLSGIPALSMESATVSASYKDSPLNALAIAKELKARFIVDGLVRKFRERNFITIRLTDSRSHGEIWEQTYQSNTTDLFAIRESMSHDISDFLQSLTISEEDIRNMEERIKDHPNDPSVYGALGVKLITIDNQRAISLFSKAIRLDSSNENYYIYAGIAGERMKDHNLASDYGRKAIRILKQKLEAHPDSLSLNVNLGIALDMAGKPDAAEDVYNAILKTHPNDVRTLYNGACCFAKDGKVDKAIDLVEHLLPIAPGKRGEVLGDPDFDNIRSSPRYAALMKKPNEQ
jgi:TolB-like protein